MNFDLYFHKLGVEVYTGNCYRNCIDIARSDRFAVNTDLCFHKLGVDLCDDNCYCDFDIDRSECYCCYFVEHTEC